MSSTLDANRQTTHGRSRLVQAVSGWSVKARHGPPRQGRGVRVNGTAMHIHEYERVLLSTRSHYYLSVALMTSLQVANEDIGDMGRHLRQLQRNLEEVRDLGEDREKRTELLLEELEALITAKEEETNRRFEEQAQENAETMQKVNCFTDSAVYNSFVWLGLD